MHIISIANQKGGVAKTTTALALCAGFAKKGFKVLGIDIDPQGSFSSSTDVVNDENVYTSYSVLSNTCKLKEAIQATSLGFDVIPCNQSLAMLDIVLATQLNGNYRLKEQIDSADLDYDYVIIDSPPSLSAFTFNALTASHEVLIPSFADNYSLEGIIKLYDTINNIKTHNNPDLKILGVVLTMFDPRPSINRQGIEVAEKYCEAIHAPLMKTRIRVNVAIKTAHTFQTSIFKYASNSHGAQDYEALVNEIIELEKND